MFRAYPVDFNYVFIGRNLSFFILCFRYVRTPFLLYRTTTGLIFAELGQWKETLFKVSEFRRVSREIRRTNTRVFLYIRK